MSDHLSRSGGWLWRRRIRLPGGLIRQHGQWYALGDDCTGIERVGVGATRVSARANLVKVLRTVERYEARGKQRV